MKKILITSSLVLGALNAQAQNSVDYFSPKGKEIVVDQLEEKMLNGCTIKLPQQPKITTAEMKYNAEGIKNHLHDAFGYSFSKNPLLKQAMDRDLDAIAADPSCEADGNKCRTKLAATAVYYFQRLRPDVDQCEGEKKEKKGVIAEGPRKNEYNYRGAPYQCINESQHRDKQLGMTGSSNGGMNQLGLYQDILTENLNDSLSLILIQTLAKNYSLKTDKKGNVIGREKNDQNMAFCGDTSDGRPTYEYKLHVSLHADPVSAVDPSKVTEKKPEPKKDPVPEKKPEPCIEEITVQHSEFVPVNFDEGSAALPQKKSDATKKDVDPVKEKIAAFIASHPDIQITNIDITSSSSKTPFYKPVGTTRVFDREYSNERNLNLANSRAGVAERILASMKASPDYPGLADAKYTTAGAINGPEFDEADLALRKVVPGSKEYKALVAKLYAENEEMLKKDAMVDSVDKLLDAKKFKSLYEAKYKPYQGFKVVISGFSKTKRKCGEKDKASVESKASEKTKTDKPAPVNTHN